MVRPPEVSRRGREPLAFIDEDHFPGQAGCDMISFVSTTLSPFMKGKENTSLVATHYQQSFQSFLSVLIGSPSTVGRNPTQVKRGMSLPGFVFVG